MRGEKPDDLYDGDGWEGRVGRAPAAHLVTVGRLILSTAHNVKGFENPIGTSTGCSNHQIHRETCMSSLTGVKKSSRCCCSVTGLGLMAKIDCSTKRQSADWQPAPGSTHKTMRTPSPKSSRRYWHERAATRSR